MSDSGVSIVIPVLNAEEFLPGLMEAFKLQQPKPPDEVILVDSNSTDSTRKLATTYKEIRLISINNFSHGRARNLGASIAAGEIIVFMTQDALPKDKSWLSNLVKPFSDERVAAVYSRQIPKQDASPMERFFLFNRFPDKNPVRKERINEKPLTLEQVFFSNVSGAVRRSVFNKYKFDEDLIMSEDQQLSRDIINAGYTVVYQPDSIVYHSHKYTLSNVFKRYFDSVYSLTLIFPDHGISTSTGMGIKYINDEIRFIIKKYPRWIPYYSIYNFTKSFATLSAHCAKWMPKWLLKKISYHSYYWKKHSDNLRK